ncbi:uncharacterized protein A1O5_01118 [Cladophialophora psammophila CBS 110553]|uniref:Uncharacterized protein n=1 Tax=Cladophialophora psammophila CBS 110553 TaxID=1182543 RepID=W9XGZ4_9EURO|nr:uncharacterized protein A1O5_01118 [Cladophialophora psammophila CBS 110553]EXJ76610.1 hypothetical protein A1O5_01118 [Cladophialophora psammophila CBS 110553]
MARDWNNAEVKPVFTPPKNTSYSYDLWAPELHFLDGAWYIIFTADVDADTPSPEQDMYCDFSCPAVNHRMFVLASSTDDPWTSNYNMRAELDTYNQFAIDGTYFVHPATGGHLYHVYSCWEGSYTSWPSMLCISRMSDPWTVSSPLSSRAVISRPDQPWEKTPYNRTINQRLSSNEGPQQLINPATGQMFIIYSAARSDNRNYCLGMLELTGTNPMDPASWTKHTAGCVFAQNPAEGVYGVGHASFTTSPDGSENWIVYHGMHDYMEGWTVRTIRTQKFSFDEHDGTPVFPAPGIGPYAVPAGQGQAQGQGSPTAQSPRSSNPALVYSELSSRVSGSTCITAAASSSCSSIDTSLPSLHSVGWETASPLGWPTATINATSTSY